MKSKILIINIKRNKYNNNNNNNMIEFIYLNNICNFTNRIIHSLQSTNQSIKQPNNQSSFSSNSPFFLICFLSKCQELNSILN